MFVVPFCDVFGHEGCFWPLFVAFGLSESFWGILGCFGAFKEIFICWEIWVFWAVSGYLDEIGAYWAVFGHLRQFEGILSLSKIYTEVLRTSVFWNVFRIEAEVDQKLTELKRSEALHSSLISGAPVLGAQFLEHYFK